MSNLKDIKKNLFSLQSCNLLPLVLLLLSLHLLLWAGLTSMSHSGPDVDNMEELVWSSSLEWGYYKHPPLPTWVVYGFVTLLGHSIWVTFIIGQLSVVLSLFFIWKLGCSFSMSNMQPNQQQGYALVAILLTSLITYFTVGGTMSNHDTMQLWSIAGSIWMFYRATHYQRLTDWGWLGLFSGFAILTKYSALIQFFSFFIYLIYTGQLKKKSSWQGIGIASLVFFLLVAPHLFWLTQHSNNPLSYAGHSFSEVSSRYEQLSLTLKFLLTNLSRILPLFIGFGFLVLWNKIAEKSVPTSSAIAKQLDSADRLFIIFIGIAPLIFTVLFALAFKISLVGHWATTFFLLFGYFSWWFLPEVIKLPQLLKRTITIVVTLQIIGSVAFALVRGPIAQATGYPARSIYPGSEITRRLLAIWNAYNQTPLTLVAADTWTGGTILINAPQKIKVLIEGDYNKSPWVQPGSSHACGMLVVIDRSPETSENSPPPENLAKLLQLSSYQGHITLPWTKHPNSPQIELDWGIIPAQANCSH